MSTVYSITDGMRPVDTATALPTGQRLMMTLPGCYRKITVVGPGDGPGRHRAVYKDGETFALYEVRTSDVGRAGIGGLTVPDEDPASPEEVAELEAGWDAYLARQKEKARKAEQEARLRMEKGKSVVEERRPAWAKAIIIGVCEENQSDPMTDYFASRQVQTVFLAWSRHTRNLFPELRKAAARFDGTAHLADGDKKDEHRENYSGGKGTYLKRGYTHSSAWLVKKIPVSAMPYYYKDAADPDNWFTNDPCGESVREQAPGNEPTQVATHGEVYIEEYSERANVIRGDTRPIKERLKELGCRWNRNLSGGPGWIYSKGRDEEVRKAIGL